MKLDVRAAGWEGMRVNQTVCDTKLHSGCVGLDSTIMVGTPDAR